MAIDVTGAEIIVVPGPCKMVWFGWQQWAVLYNLTPQERGQFWEEGAVRVHPYGMGPIAFVVADERLPEN